jgi:hypothetical protein
LHVDPAGAQSARRPAVAFDWSQAALDPDEDGGAMQPMPATDMLVDLSNSCLMMAAITAQAEKENELLVSPSRLLVLSCAAWHY